MRINIKYMTDEAYRTLQKNYKEIYQMILAHPSDCSWLKDYLGFEPFEEKKYEIEDFVLQNSEKYSEVAFENGKILFETLNKLPRYVLCNNKFWAWITFDKAYKQAINSTKNAGPQIIKNWWVAGTSRRDLMLGVISRGYFRTEVSYDETRGDCYALTKYLLTNKEIYSNIVFRNIGMLKNVTLGLLQAQKDISEKYNISLNRLQSRQIMKDASRIGSVMLIDIMPKEEIYEILYKKLDDMIVNKIEMK